MQYKPGNWVTGFKRSPRAANVQHRDMGLFLNSSGKFEPIDDSWDNLHSGGLFISDDNKLYFRDETNKDIYINSPAAETLGLSAGNATTAGFVTINEEGFDTDFRVEASGNENALFVRGSSGFIGLGTTTPRTVLHATGAANTEGTMLIAYGTASANPARASILRFSENPDNFQGGYVRYDGSANEIIIGGHDEADADAANDDDILYVNRTNTTVGIGQSAPTTLLELFGTAPYLTLRNSTHENTEGGRESKIIFEGERTGGADSTLAVIQASHDGTGDDEKGDLIFSTNDGNDAAAPTEAMRIDSAGQLGIGDASLGKTSDYSYANDLLINSVNASNYGGITIKGADGTDVNGIRFAIATGSGTNTYKGFVQYSHVNNSMELGTSSLARLKIDTDGAVTKPAQPAFLAHPTSAQTSLAVGEWATIVLGTEVFDQGGDFASNTFTAPVTGRYQFNFETQLGDVDSAASYYQIRLKTSNRDYYLDIVKSDQLAGDADYWTLGNSVLADMDAADTAYCEIIQSGGTVQSSISTSTYLSGFLAC